VTDPDDIMDAPLDGGMDLGRRSAMNALTERQDAAINAVNAVLGAILLASPWLLNFTAEQVPTWNAVISGAVIAIVAFAAFTRMREWEEWIGLAIGLWAMVSPWLLGFAGSRPAMWTHVIIGLLVAALAGIELWRTHGTPPTRSA
jgi:hypothetical protein